MTFEEFMYYLEAYGASLHRWPRELRETAQAFLAGSPAAGAARAETARLDALLDRLELVPDKGAKTRVEAQARAVATRVAAGTSGRFSLRAGVESPWSRAAMLAAVAVLGIVTGSIWLESPQNAVPALDVAQLHADDSPFEVAGL
jgi:hypothetical protein